MILLPMATYMLGNAAAARFVPRFGSLQLLLTGRALAFAGAVAMALWAGSAPLSVWLLFLPIALAEIGDGMSGPAVMAAALSIRPRLAGTASGLMGVLQMAAAALGSFVVALLRYRNAFGMIAFTVALSGSGWLPPFSPCGVRSHRRRALRRSDRSCRARPRRRPPPTEFEGRNPDRLNRSRSAAGAPDAPRSVQRDRCDHVGGRLRDPVEPQGQQHGNGGKPEREPPPQSDRAVAERER